MPTTKKTKESVNKETAKKADKYFYGVGKRKTAIAQVKIFPTSKAPKEITINEKKGSEFFSISRLKDVAGESLLKIGQEGKFEVVAKVSGGGVNSQAEAVRLGVARALVKADEAFRKPLKDLGLLTRDSRAVERKKPGLKKARRSPQWAKR